jgi:hypothetical protein
MMATKGRTRTWKLPLPSPWKPRPETGQEGQQRFINQTQNMEEYSKKGSVRVKKGWRSEKG